MITFKTSHASSTLYLKQLGATFFIKIFSVIISLLYIPLVLDYLDQEKYGIWITLTTVINWIRLLDIGMGNGMRNKLAEVVAIKDYSRGRVYVSTTYGIIGSIFLLALLIFHFINPFLNWQVILNSTNISPVELLSLTNIVFTFIVLGFILQPITLIYTAHGNSAASGFIQLVISGTCLMLIWIVSKYFMKGNIVLLAWIITGIPVFVYAVFSFYTFLYKYPKLRPSFKQIKISESGSLLQLSAGFFIVQITATILYSSIPFVIAQLFSPNEVVVFNTANTIFSLPVMVISLVTTPLLPLVTQAYTKLDYVWLRRILKKMNMIALLVAIGTVLLIFISPFVYHIWIGDQVAIPFNLSVTIGIYTIINVLVNPFSTFTNGIGKIRILVILAPVGIAMFLGFSILFTKITHDVASIPIALSITSLMGLIVLPITLRKYKIF